MFKYTRHYTTKPSLANLQNFWERITVDLTPTVRRVCIDGKPLKTPNGGTMEIPLTKPAILAELIAQEWRVLPSLKLKSHMVPLTSLASRALDLTTSEKPTVIGQLLPYLDTDTLAVLSPPKDCEGELRKAQEALYPHVIQDACDVWGLPSDGITVLDTETKMFGNYQPANTKEKVTKWMEEIDPWRFASLERATTAAKSLIVGMNIALNRRPVSELAMLSSLDVIHQTALWGEVEDTHDVDREELHRLLGAAYVNAMEENPSA